MTAYTIGLYVRTSILTDKYDRYEKALLLYCKQQQWGNVKHYRDRVGGRIEQSGFDSFERGLRKGEVDEDAIARLMQQQTEDEEHNRDAFASLIRDAAAGTWLCLSGSLIEG